MNKYIVNGLIKATEAHSAIQCNDLTRGAMQLIRWYWEKVSNASTFEEAMEVFNFALLIEGMIKWITKTYPDYADTLNACYEAIDKYRLALPVANLKK